MTGLKAENFRLASHIGLVKDFKVTSADEWEWEPGDVEPAGCYALDVMITPTESSLEALATCSGFRRAPSAMISHRTSSIAAKQSLS